MVPIQVKIPVTVPSTATKITTLEIPFFMSVFSPKKNPILKRNPIKNIAPTTKGKAVFTAVEKLCIGVRIPSNCAKAEDENRKIMIIRVKNFFIIGCFLNKYLTKVI